MSNGEQAILYEPIPQVTSPYDTPFEPSFSDVYLVPTDLPPPGFPQGEPGPTESPVDMGLPPLVVDVYGGTPEPTPSDIARDLLFPTSPPGLFQPPPVEGAGATPEGGGIMSDGFLPGGIYFPSDPGSIIGDIASAFFTATGTPAEPTQALSYSAPRRISHCYRHGRAPVASLFGGNCPPGTVLRRKPLARDICIKRPHMNVLNPCALSKATRRVTGFLNKVKNTQKHLVKALSHAGVHGTRRAMTGRRGGGCVTCGARTRSACVC